ncbi:hypothetical protein SRHO_G00338730 [Serrasalmus rhombeus]
MGASPQRPLFRETGDQEARVQQVALLCRERAALLRVTETRSCTAFPENSRPSSGARTRRARLEKVKVQSGYSKAPRAWIRDRLENLRRGWRTGSDSLPLFCLCKCVLDARSCPGNQHQLGRGHASAIAAHLAQFSCRDALRSFVKTKLRARDRTQPRLGPLPNRWLSFRLISPLLFPSASFPARRVQCSPTAEPPACLCHALIQARLFTSISAKPY